MSDSLAARQLNGFAHRVESTEKTAEGNRVRSTRNEKDIGKMWDSIDDIRDDIKAIIWKVALVVGLVTGLVNGATILVVLFKG